MQTRMIRFIYTFIIFFSFCTFSHAAHVSILQINKWRPFLTLTGGAAFADLGGSQTLPIIDSSLYTYSNDHSHQTRAIWGVFLGGEFLLNCYSSLQLGLAAYDQVSFSPEGDLTQGVDPQSSDQFRYKYHIRYKQLLLESKWLFNWYGIYHPYLLIGVGESYNKASDYRTNVPPFLTFTPQFSDHSTHSFSYSAGLGIDVDIFPCWRLGVGYRYSDLGKVRLGNGVIDTVQTSSHLSQSHSHLNEVVAQLTFLMN